MGEKVQVWVVMKAVAWTAMTVSILPGYALARGPHQDSPGFMPLFLTEDAAEEAYPGSERMVMNVDVEWLEVSDG